MKDEQKLDGVNPLVMFEQVWIRRKTLIIIICMGIFVGFGISWSIPNDYRTIVKIVPDKSTIETGDFISDVVASKPFLLSFWDLEVNKLNSKDKILLRDYILKEQKFPWWKSVIDFPSTIFGRKNKSEVLVDSVNLFRLTPDQNVFVDRMNRKIKLQIDKRNGIMSLKVSMQEPMISALVAHEIFGDMQDLVKDKKTHKANIDLHFYEKLLEDAHGNYQGKQENLSKYVNQHNRDNSGISVVERERLKQEIELAYTSYGSMAEQLDKAKMKVQEETPVFAVIEPATIPSFPSEPRTLLIVLGCTFLFGFCGTIGLLVKGVFK